MLLKPAALLGALASVAMPMHLTVLVLIVIVHCLAQGTRAAATLHPRPSVNPDSTGAMYLSLRPPSLSRHTTTLQASTRWLRGQWDGECPGQQAAGYGSTFTCKRGWCESEQQMPDVFVKIAQDALPGYNQDACQYLHAFTSSLDHHVTCLSLRLTPTSRQHAAVPQVGCQSGKVSPEASKGGVRDCHALRLPRKGCIQYHTAAT